MFGQQTHREAQKHTRLLQQIINQKRNQKQILHARHAQRVIIRLFPKQNYLSGRTLQWHAEIPRD